MAEPLERRIATLEREILTWLEKEWGLERHEEALRWGEGWQSVREESVRWLESRRPAETLGGLLADMYFHTGLWWERYDLVDDRAERWEARQRLWRRRNLLWAILGAGLRRFPPPDIYARLERCLVRLNDLELPLSRQPHPNVEECLDLLLALPPSAENLALAEKAVLELFLYTRSTSLVLDRLLAHGQFDYNAFRRFARRHPEWLLGSAERAHAWRYRNLSPAFIEGIQAYCRRLIREFEAEPSDADLPVIGALRGWTGPAGLLVTAARLHSGRWRRALSAQSDAFTLAGAIVSLVAMADASHLGEEERVHLLDRLKAFPEKTLRRLLPLAVRPEARRLLAEAAGWPQALPLVEAIAGIARLDERALWSSAKIAISNHPDPSVGVVPVATVRDALAEAGETLSHEVIDLFRKAKVSANNTLILVEAVAGWNREWIEERLPKRNQLAVKAYGLLPLRRGADEVLGRYLFLKQFAAESKKFGPERQANERAAAQASLTNLAQVAGYSDVVRLEWAMEARLGRETGGAGSTWRLGEYLVELSFEEGEPGLVVRQGERRLKSLPAAVRKSDLYPEIRAAVGGLRRQATRLRETFEGLMANEEPLSREDLESLAHLPIASDLLGRLIGHTGDGTFGLFDLEALALRTPAGDPVPIADRVYISHPYHLFQAGRLAAWQREIVHRRVVQPFKQAFRELYLLTPAEEEALTPSNRFAHHVLDPRVASRLFQARGWQIQSGDIALPYKLFPQHGVRAIFELPDAGHFMSETAQITSGPIYFQEYPPRRIFGAWSMAERVTLREVPPLVFSEVMRDADLVVSVAQRAERAPISHESYQRRGELVATLLDDLGLSGVRIDGHFARVRGKLTHYRVHLGSAAIHIEPGGYLCIVPDRWGRTHERLFLPFAAEGDEKIAEVISKILLLLNDDKIKDESILRQIRARRAP